MKIKFSGFRVQDLGRGLSVVKGLRLRGKGLELRVRDLVFRV